MIAGDTGSGKDLSGEDIAGQAGVLPNFFHSSSAAAGPLEQSWAFVRSAYLDNPLPPLLKERLFVHLSRFGETRDCLVRHVGLLIGEGRPEAPSLSPEQMIRLLARPVPDAMTLERAWRWLGAGAQPQELPDAGTEGEAWLFDALAVMFLTPAQSDRARAAVRAFVGDRHFESLTVFLAFTRAAHFWTQIHPELEIPPYLTTWLAEHRELAAILLDPPEAGDASPAGQVRRALADIDRAVVEGQDSLHESEERYRALFDAIDQGFCVVEMLYDEQGRAEDYRFLQVNQAFVSQTGLEHAVGRRMKELAPLHEDHWFEIYGRIAHSGQAERFQNRADALGRWYEVMAFPIGRPDRHRVGVIFNDIADRKRAEEALRASERRLQTLVEGVPQLVWRATDVGEWTWASPQWTAYTGQTEPGSHGSDWLGPVHPEDREKVKAIWAEAVGRGEFRADYRIRHAPDGRYRWFQTRATAVRDDQDQIVEWLGTSTDIDDLRRLQGRQQVLLAELQHRVRNILTVVRSVFARTIEAGGELEDIADHFRGRLDSLARTLTVVTQSVDGMVDLENLIRDELLSVGAGDGPSLTIGGPEVSLSGKAAESIGLAIHELTTNALKYGALAIPGAELDIRWSANMDYGGGRRLDLRWVEQGVPAIAVDPARRGFGSDLITEALPYQLGAETTLQFAGGGVRCTISVPLPEEGASTAPVGREG